jgi:hypothetical protein
MAPIVNRNQKIIWKTHTLFPTGRKSVKSITVSTELITVWLGSIPLISLGNQYLYNTAIDARPFNPAFTHRVLNDLLTASRRRAVYAGYSGLTFGTAYVPKRPDV